MEEYCKQYPDNNMFIEASAGTGKTHTIISLVTQLTARGLPLEKILIVTYTEKAAGELKDRIRSALKLDSVDTASIFTIHSFCQKTIDEFAFNARTAYEQDMLDDGESERFIERALRDTLKHEAHFCFLFENMDNFLSKLTAELSRGIAQYYQKNNGAAVPSVVTLDTTEEDWNELEAAFTEASTDKARKALVTKLYQQYVEELLPRFYRLWQQYKSEQKAQSFNDMLRTVREAVLDPATGLKTLLQEKYRYAIIDEFQDTNQKQWDIFTAIFTGSDSHQLIVVGDPKQSIYAFQGANVQVYKNAVESIEKNGGNAYSLSYNWRSSEKLIEAFNTLFSSHFFSANNCTYTPSLPPPDKEKRIPLPTLYQPSSGAWEACAPVWLSAEGDEKAFAKAAVQQIIAFARFVPETGKTALQIGAKKDGSYIVRSVSFKDFAILARSRDEMEPIERELKATGIPFRRYKDDKVFATRECQNWISLFSAIAAPDFSGQNRRLLSECLFTDFFRTDRSSHRVQQQLAALESAVYDSPDAPERRLLAKWKHLADSKKWAAFLEAIYEDTAIEQRFSQLDELDSLARYRQLGDYAIEYLYAHNATLEDGIAHLRRLSKKSESAENDANLLAKNTDFDCVQIMTIHASKGLEFPVIISTAGFKRPRKNESGPYLYNAGGRTHLSFDDSVKEARAEEAQREWERLFYVAYTRPTQLLLLPYYTVWKDKDGKPEQNFAFLKNSIDAFTQTRPDLLQSFSYHDERLSAQKEAVAAILSEAKRHSNEAHMLAANKALDAHDGATDEPATAAADATQALKAALKAATVAIEKSAVHQHSYSSLAGAKLSLTTDDGRVDADEQGTTEACAGFDRAALPVAASYERERKLVIQGAYPKGKFIGNALHEVLERVDFALVGKKTLEEALCSEPLLALIQECLSRQGIEQQSLIEPTARLVWHTLNASFPIVAGSASSSGTFTLSDIPEQARKAELEFELNLEGKAGDICKGFIDLLLLREEDGEARYSIIDWKSDLLPPEAYSDGKALKAKVDSDYAIQRVLYAYSLIRWLKQFYPQDDYQTIFSQHFGGSYYVFLRGCHAESANGIYAQTWKSWNDLQHAFEEIKESM